MRNTIWTILLLILAANTGWFVAYSAGLGLEGLRSDAPATVSRVFADGAPLTNAALALHMLAGALVTVGAPLQALPILRYRWRRLHRRLGYTLLVLATITGLGGLVYIGVRGTVGGAWMSLWFAIYGLALMGCAAATVYAALDKDMESHFAWATRFVILAVGSWIYRMHYGLWFMLTGGTGSAPDFTGLFDQVQVFAFFVPYLLAAELLLRRTGVKTRRA